jgi:hypothetical protein
MSNINTDFLIYQINELKHFENPDVESPELQAFVNGWNNALKEVLLFIENNINE